MTCQPAHFPLANTPGQHDQDNTSTCPSVFSIPGALYILASTTSIRVLSTTAYFSALIPHSTNSGLDICEYQCQFWSVLAWRVRVRSAEASLHPAVSLLETPRCLDRLRAAAKMSVSQVEVHQAQKAWSDAIVGISKVYLEKGDYVTAAAKAAGELYGYGHCDVLFKPTKAKDVQFRPMASQAMSYFVSCKAVTLLWLRSFWSTLPTILWTPCGLLPLALAVAPVSSCFNRNTGE